MDIRAREAEIRALRPSLWLTEHAAFILCRLDETRAALNEIAELSTTADSVYVEARNIALRALGRESECE